MMPMLPRRCVIIYVIFMKRSIIKVSLPIKVKVKVKIDM